MTHDELIEHGAEWLKAKNCKVIITDMAHAGSETPDAIGWTGNGRSILLEAKVSRNDFKKDAKKAFRRSRHTGGMGCIRYYITPPGLVKPEELLPGWGLLEVHEPKGRQKKARVSLVLGHNPGWVPKQFMHETNLHREVSLLLSALRRIGQECPKGVSVRAYTFQTNNRATLGVVPIQDKKEPKLCSVCGKKPPMDGSTICQECDDKLEQKHISQTC